MTYKQITLYVDEASDIISWSWVTWLETPDSSPLSFSPYALTKSWHVIWPQLKRKVFIIAPNSHTWSWWWRDRLHRGMGLENEGQWNRWHKNLTSLAKQCVGLHRTVRKKLFAKFQWAKDRSSNFLLHCWLPGPSPCKWVTVYCLNLKLRTFELPFPHTSLTSELWVTQPMISITQHQQTPAWKRMVSWLALPLNVCCTGETNVHVTTFTQASPPLVASGPWIAVTRFLPLPHFKSPSPTSSYNILESDPPPLLPP